MCSRTHEGKMTPNSECMDRCMCGGVFQRYRDKQCLSQGYEGVMAQLGTRNPLPPSRVQTPKGGTDGGGAEAKFGRYKT